MEFKLIVTHILAIGCWKSYMWVKMPYEESSTCVCISREFYYKLKEVGVPTSQYLRYKK